MKKYQMLLAFLLPIGLQLFAQARLVEKVIKKGSELVIPYEKYVYPNGLILIVHEDHSDPIVHVDITYHVGSAREEIGKSGFAHFFEHMMSQGSEHVADQQHFKIVTEAGGTLNGSTNRDRTNYYQTVPNNQLEKMLWLEADRMGFLLDAVTQKKFEIQRATVKNERGQSYDNVPYGLQLEYLTKNLYPYGHPYSWVTIGDLEDLNRSDVNDLKNFFLRWYGPNNAVLTIGGDVKTAEVVKLVDKYFGSITRRPDVKPAKFDPVVLEKNRYVSYIDNYAKNPMLVIVYPGVPDYHPDAPALSLLANILGGGNSNSVFYQHIIKPKKALQVNTGSFTSELAGEFPIFITPPPDKSLSDMEKLVDEGFAEFEKRGATDEDVERFRASNESALINGLARVSGKVSTLAEHQTFSGNPNKIKNILEGYQKLTKEDVVRVYNKYIKNKNRVVLSTLVKGQEHLIAAPDNYKIDTTDYRRPNYGYTGLKYVKPKDNFNRKKMPLSGPNPVVIVPKFWRKDLANGIKIIGTENSEIPVVTISISIPGGHLLQANDLSKVGLANIFARMMSESTKNFTSEQFTTELQKLGSIISVSSSNNAVIFNMQSLKKNVDKTIALLQERLLQPNFSEDAFNRIKIQTLQRLKQSNSQPSLVANAVFATLNFGVDHILGKPLTGTETSIQNIKFEDIQNFYNSYISSVGTKVVIVGDVKEQEILSKMSFLQQLPKKKIELPKLNGAPKIDRTKVYLVDIPKAAQTEIRIGNAIDVKYDVTRDFYKMTLMNFPLGGAFNSRINLNLRENKGWSYSARSSFNASEYNGDFTFSSGVKAEVTDSAVAEVMSEIKNYVSRGPSDEEINFTKSAIGQRDALAYETGIQKANFLRRILDYNLPADYVVQQTKILKSVTKMQMKSVAQKYLNPEKMNIVLVGDKQKILDGLKMLNYEIIEVDVYGNVVKKAL